MTGALDDVRVLELTDGVAGSVAGMLLADLGADVLTLRSPGRGPSASDPGLHVWDRNKRAAILDSSIDVYKRQLVAPGDRGHRRQRQPGRLTPSFSEVPVTVVRRPWTVLLGAPETIRRPASGFGYGSGFCVTYSIVANERNSRM